MIISGSKSSHLKSASLEGASCPHCNTTGQMIMSVYSKYVHIFWIPVLPLSKKVYAKCNHCKANYELNELPPEIKQRCYLFGLGQKYPLRHFFGLIGMGVCVILLNILTGISIRTTNANLNNPMVNDVYVVKYEKNYSTMKIVEISGETVFFSENEYSVSSISKTHEIDKDENYDSEELLKYTTGELRDLKNKGIITSIRRK